MRRILITGANRGLGLEFTRQYLKRGERVFATCRKPGLAQELTRLALAHPGRLNVLPLEVSNPRSVAELVKELALVTESLDQVVNNAGLLHAGERYGALEAKSLEDAFATNTVGPVLVTQALTPLLEKGTAAVLVNLSSALGSIAAREVFGTPSYSISKAALNMATRLMAFELAARGITAVALHPGWVKTDMGGANAELATPDAVAALIHVIDAITPAQAGKFLAWDGEELPW
jgi:NAD(P)-dependent dehydrogenase (short-subunit alcohol dehydrogenase family)